VVHQGVYPFRGSPRVVPTWLPADVVPEGGSAKLCPQGLSKHGFPSGVHHAVHTRGCKKESLNGRPPREVHQEV
jgi:hypothetical protein